MHKVLRKTAIKPRTSVISESRVVAVIVATNAWKAIKTALHCSGNIFWPINTMSTVNSGTQYLAWTYARMSCARTSKMRLPRKETFYTITSLNRYINDLSAQQLRSVTPPTLRKSRKDLYLYLFIC